MYLFYDKKRKICIVNNCQIEKCESFVIAEIGGGGYNFIIGIIASVCRGSASGQQKNWGSAVKNACIWTLKLYRNKRKFV